MFSNVPIFKILYNLNVSIIPLQEEKLLTSASVTERVKIWERCSGLVDEAAIMRTFFNKIHRPRPPVRHRVKLALRGRIKVTIVCIEICQRYFLENYFCCDQNNFFYRNQFFLFLSNLKIIINYSCNRYLLPLRMPTEIPGTSKVDRVSLISLSRSFVSI